MRAIHIFTANGFYTAEVRIFVCRAPAAALYAKNQLAGAGFLFVEKNHMKIDEIPRRVPAARRGILF